MVEGLVGSVGVVVIDVAGDESLELVLVPDDGAVEELAADRSDPSLGERVCHRCADRGAEDLEFFGSEYLVEGGGELAAAISNEGAGTGETVSVGDEQVAGGLGGPRAGRVRRARVAIRR